jgi:hypothetical protein
MYRSTGTGHTLNQNDYPEQNYPKRARTRPQPGSKGIKAPAIFQSSASTLIFEARAGMDNSCFLKIW